MKKGVAHFDVLVKIPLHPEVKEIPIPRSRV